MGKLYSASSLEDIASLFDQRAAIANQQSKRTTVLKHAALYDREASVWHTAAAILRDTDLKKEAA
jgi:hypothetical protein